MPKYLIENSHESSHTACVQAVDSFLQAGAHYLTNAEWGCRAGVHTAWIIVDVANDTEARLAVPPVIRRTAKVIKLNRFTPDEIRNMREELE